MFSSFSFNFCVNWTALQTSKLWGKSSSHCSERLLRITGAFISRFAVRFSRISGAPNFTIDATWYLRITRLGTCSVYESNVLRIFTILVCKSVMLFIQPKIKICLGSAFLFFSSCVPCRVILAFVLNQFLQLELSGLLFHAEGFVRGSPHLPEHKQGDQASEFCSYQQLLICFGPVQKEMLVLYLGLIFLAYTLCMSWGVQQEPSAGLS